MTSPALAQQDEAIIRLDGVSVLFPVYQAGSRSLKKRILFHGSRGNIGRDARDQIVVAALRDISLSVALGDRVALIGANGAGKTTLLRTMAGIYEPVEGEVRTRGRISPMLDINLGIDVDLSGYDNICLRAALLGLPTLEIEQRLQAELLKQPAMGRLGRHMSGEGMIERVGAELDERRDRGGADEAVEQDRDAAVTRRESRAENRRKLAASECRRDAEWIAEQSGVPCQTCVDDLALPP